MNDKGFDIARKNSNGRLDVYTVDADLMHLPIFTYYGNLDGTVEMYQAATGDYLTLNDKREVQAMRMMLQTIEQAMK